MLRRRCSTAGWTEKYGKDNIEQKRAACIADGSEFYYSCVSSEVSVASKTEVTVTVESVFNDASFFAFN